MEAGRIEEHADRSMFFNQVPVQSHLQELLRGKTEHKNQKGDQR